MNRLFKVAGLVGGGILAIGSGAMGTHLAYPTLEKNLFPQRINDESKLKESLDEVNDQVQHLANSLALQTSINSTQEETILNLDKKVKDLTKTFSEKEELLKSKIQDISKKQNEITKQEQENAQQQTQIQKLNEEYLQKETQFLTTKAQKEEVQSSLTKIEEKLDLTREDILKSTAPNLDSLKIERRKITRKSFSDGWATFESDDSSGTKKEFKVEKPKEKFINYEKTAKDLQKNGIAFKLDSSFHTWNKSIELVTYTADYHFSTTSSEYEKKFVLKDSKKTKTLKITDYFKDKYLEDAFRVLHAIEYLDWLPLCRVLNNKHELKFCDNVDIKFDFSEKGTLNLKQFSESTEDKKIVSFWTNMFKTPENFMNYWVDKTIDLIRTGTVDLLDFMNPILFEKNYESSI